MEKVQVEKRDKVRVESQIASTEEVRNEIEKICRNRTLLNKYTYITFGKIMRYFDADNINGDNAHDVLQNIFEKFLSGKRKWSKINERTFENQLIMTIISYIRNEYIKLFGSRNPRKSNDNKNKTPKIFSIYGENGDTDEKYLRDESQDFDSFDCKETEIFENEIEAIIQKFSVLLEHDEDAYYVFDELLKVGNSDIKIAKNLGMQIEDVRKAKKRIRRAAAKIRI